MKIEQLMKFKIGQKVWYFDANLWKPIADVVYDFKNGLYILEEAGGDFSDIELFTSKLKCWGDKKNI